MVLRHLSGGNGGGPLSHPPRVGQLGILLTEEAGGDDL